MGSFDDFFSSKINVLYTSGFAHLFTNILPTLSRGYMKIFIAFEVFICDHFKKCPPSRLA